MRKRRNGSLGLVIVALVLLGAHPLNAQQKQPEPQKGKPIVVPTRFAGNRFVAVPITSDGVTLSLFTDSAGSLFLYEDTAERLKLTPELVAGDNGNSLRVVSLPAFKTENSIPAPLGSSFQQRLFVFPRNRQLDAVLEHRDGMLGQQWFGGRVWTFDYPGKRLLWRADGDIPAHDASHEVRLGFKTSGSGTRQNNFARIPVEIDGETLDFVLDTGATNVITEEQKKLLGDDLPLERATSFLVRSVYEKWHQKHPEWRVLEEKTLTGGAMIEVPQLAIGGYKVGPVWFTVQPDVGFQGVMKPLMDKPIVGALGGSALHYFRLTVDWPNAIAIFERP
jgi:hypothetical protein